jgi:hypothetical protein
VLYLAHRLLFAVVVVVAETEPGSTVAVDVGVVVVDGVVSGVEVDVLVNDVGNVVVVTVTVGGAVAVVDVVVVVSTAMSVVAGCPSLDGVATVVVASVVATVVVVVAVLEVVLVVVVAVAVLVVVDSTFSQHSHLSFEERFRISSKWISQNRVNVLYWNARHSSFSAHSTLHLQERKARGRRRETKQRNRSHARACTHRTHSIREHVVTWHGSVGVHKLSFGNRRKIFASNATNDASSVPNLQTDVSAVLTRVLLNRASLPAFGRQHPVPPVNVTLSGSDPCVSQKPPEVTLSVVASATAVGVVVGLVDTGVVVGVDVWGVVLVVVVGASLDNGFK